MRLSEQQKKLIQDSFNKANLLNEQASKTFYDKLFEYAPSLRHIFTSDIKIQGQKFMAMVKVIVDGLEEMDNLTAKLNALAENHIKYGVSVDDYTPMGNALIFTLKANLGDDFTAEVKKAWQQLYTGIADIMRQSAYPEFDPRRYKNLNHYNR